MRLHRGPRFEQCEFVDVRAEDEPPLLAGPEHESGRRIGGKTIDSLDKLFHDLLRQDIGRTPLHVDGQPGNVGVVTAQFEMFKGCHPYLPGQRADRPAGWVPGQRLGCELAKLTAARTICSTLS